MKKSTTITISVETKNFLEEVKGRFEEKYNRKFTWDEFLEIIAVRSMEDESYLELDNEEAKVILELTIEGRKRWRRYV